MKLRLLRSLALLGLACAACSDAPPRARSPAWSIARDDIRSVPELLATLPESLRARYVLLFETRSPQGASYEAPRAILFSDDAREVVAFGGGSDSVDLMTFDDTSTSFVLREVTFPVLAGQPRMVVSEANPARCRACHGTPAGPIWDTYPLWPGAYGESDRLPPPEEERQGLARFSSQREAHPRYRYLPVHRTTAADEAERRYLGQAAVAANAELGELLGGLSARVIAAELRAAPGFERHRYDALAALVPLCRERGGARERPDYAAFVDATWRANAVQAAYKQARAHLPPGTALPSVPDDTAMTRLRYVAERDLGVSTAGWTLALEKGTFDYEASRRPAGSLARRLFQELVGADDRLRDLYWNAADTTELCAYLARRTRLAPSTPLQPAPPPADDRVTLLERCATCHEHGVGPAIPFAHPDDLAPRLNRRVGLHASLLEAIAARLRPEAGAGRMPMVRNADEDEQRALLQYLAALAAGASPP